MMRGIFVFFFGDTDAEKIVPPTGYTVRLTVLAAAAMAFLATFALAFAFATGKLATRWSTDLARTSTIRITAPPAQATAQVQAVLRVLDTTEGVAAARVIEVEEQKALLAPWFGPDLPVETLSLPYLIEVVETQTGLDLENLRFRLAAEAPGAVFDDHRRWQRPLSFAANRLRVLGWVCVGLILFTLAIIVTLAAQSALAANQTVIEVMRLVGARDSYIARAFVRRFTVRAFVGAALGAGFGAAVIFAMPAAGGAAGFLTGLRFTGQDWAVPAVLPFLSAIVAYFATRRSAKRTLKGLS